MFDGQVRLAGWVLVCMAVLPMSHGRAGSVIWWEGESPVSTNFPSRTWFSPKGRETDLLSGGNWLTCDGTRQPGQAERYARYRLTVNPAGTYHLWARKFWKHGPFRWRFDRQAWRTCGPDVVLADNVTLRTHVCANWVYLGEVELAQGAHDFEIRLLAGPGRKMTACFDCFVLSASPFVPNGKHRPGQRTGLADAGRFAWEPAVDRLTDQALLDLRHLNEKRAGQHGRVRRQDGCLVLGDGRPVRFWAVNVGSANAGQNRASVDYLAARLARLGVNLVRYHSPLFDPTDPRRIDRRKLDDLHYLVAAMARQGIYTHLSFYFPLWCDARRLPGLDGYDQTTNKHPFALLYFHEPFQQIYRQWLEQILAPVNPYTRRPLADDSALAMVEMVNEDSLFFWTFSRKNIPLAYWQALERRFGRWLQQRYGSFDKALETWGGGREPADRPESGCVGLFEAWHMTGAAIKQAAAARRRRLADQIRFLAELQRRFYDHTAADLRRLGYTGLTVASNWHTADPTVLDALERWTYTAADVIDCHGYFGGKHEGEGSAFSVRAGHTFQSIAGVQNPLRLPLRFAQVTGRPQIISELNWTNPNRFRADAVVLAALYAALQGCDGVYWFAVGNNFLADRSMRKFAVGCPAIAGAFPAAALVYRLGLVETAEPAVIEHLPGPRLFSLSPTGPAGATALDALRRADLPAGTRTVAPEQAGALLPLAYYVGPVERHYGAGSDETGQTVNLKRYIDRRKKTLTSLTGQLHWDYGRGLVTVQAPRVRGVVGFTRQAGAVKLGRLTVRCNNDYASVLVVGLDGRPVERSRRLLVQVLTNERPYGFSAENGRIVNLGGYPFGLEKVDCRLELEGGWGAAELLVLDENGYRRRSEPVDESRGPGIRLAEDAIYQLVVRQENQEGTDGSATWGAQPGR